MQRRTFLATSLGAVTVLPSVSLAAGHSGMQFATDAGPITIHPVRHASFVMETPAGVIYVDTVGGAELYAGLPAPDLILITHEHGDHYDVATLEGVTGQNTPIITNPAVYDMLPDALQARATSMGNGESGMALDYALEAIPAYNLTEDRLNFHPEGRDNGYVMTVGGKRIYIAGDTEDIPEMRALENIEIAFIPMNLPYTMDINAAADAVAEFQPAFVFPYHYGDSDVEAFKAMVDDMATATQVELATWYPSA